MLTRISFNRKSIKAAVIGLFLITSAMSCRKSLQVEMMAGELTEETVFNSNTTAIGAVNGLLIRMSNPTGLFHGNASISLFCGLAADEFDLLSVSDTRNGYYRNSLSALISPVTGSETWLPLYFNINQCNIALKRLTRPEAESISPAIKKQLIAESRFIRALNYFYLVNFYGDVPLVTGTNLSANLQLLRSPKADVYKFIADELKISKEALADNYLDGTLTASTTERVRPTKWAASAFLARVYLYMEDYVNAEAESSAVIANSGMFDLVPLNNVFLKNSKEAIWQLQPSQVNFNTADPPIFIARQPSIAPTFINLSTYLLSAFETGDQRRVNGNWVQSQTIGSNTYQSPFKYKLYISDPNINTTTGTQNMTEYLMMFRLAEQYLIRAEARAKQNQLPASIADLDKIRARAGLALVANTRPGITQTALLDAILQERRVELFSELGHRWLDLKRTGKIDAVMSVTTPLKTQGVVSWQSYQQLFPIPRGDIDKSRLTQNPGY